MPAAMEQDTCLDELLKRLGLERFSKPLVGVGATTPGDIKWLEDGDFLALGLNLVQIRRLQAVAREGLSDDEDDALSPLRNKGCSPRRSSSFMSRLQAGEANMMPTSSDPGASRHWLEQASSRPLRLVFIRHGESEGNVNRTITKVVPDHLLHLTKNGRAQALDAGRRLCELIGDEISKFIVSPYVRTVETLNGIKQRFGREAEVREDLQIREQEHGNLDAENMGQLHQHAQKFGMFYFRFPDGESPADCYDRASLFLESLYRGWEYNRSPNQVFIGHGLMILVIIMRLMRLSVDEFLELEPLANCELVVLERDPQNPKFTVSFVWRHGMEREYGGLRRKAEKPNAPPVWDGKPDSELLVSETINEPEVASA